MEGFLSNNLRDLISIVGLIIALGSPVFYLFKHIFQSSSALQSENQNKLKSRNKNAKNLKTDQFKTAIANYFRSPSDDFKETLSWALICFFVTALAFYIFPYVPNWLAGILIFTCIFTIFMQFFALLVLTGEIADGISQQLNHTIPKWLWKFFISVLWSSFLLFCILLLNILPLGSWLSILVFSQLVGVGCSIILLIIGYIGEYLGL